MKNAQTKKLLSFLLVLCMTVSLLPGHVWAIGDDETASSPETTESTVEELLEPIIVTEDITKRGESEKHFLCDDGSYIAVSYPSPVHEQVEGQWVDVEYDVAEDSNGISPVDETIKVKLANNTNSAKLVKLEAGGYKISWTVEAENEDGDTTEKVKLSKDSKAAIKTNKEITKANKELLKNAAKYSSAEVFELKDNAKKKIESLKKAKSANVENDSDVASANAAIEDYNRQQILSVAFAQSNVEYVGAFGEGTTLRYLLTPGSINEEVVLNKYDGFKSYSMVMDTDGLTPVKNEFGRVDLTDGDGNVVISIAPPYMYDSADALSEAVDVTVSQESKKSWRITYTPDADWLKDQSRVYPVVIDPAMETSQNFLVGNLFDTYVYNGQTAAVDTALPTLRVGYENGVEHITYWGIDDYPPFVPNGYTMTGASFHIRFQGGTTTMGTIGLYDASDYWDDDAFSWDDKPDIGTCWGTISSVPSDLWLVYSSDDMADCIETLYNDGMPKYRVALKYTSYVNDYNWFFSSEYRPNGDTSYTPYLAVHYNGTTSGGGTVDPTPEPDPLPDLNYTTAFATGDYIIESVYNGRYLHHTESNNTVNVWTYNEQPHQKWYLYRNGNGTYSFIPYTKKASGSVGLSYDYMELYYGVDGDQQPITTYDYTDNTDSPHCNFRIIDNLDGTYSIMPSSTTERVLEVYTGTINSENFNGRYFNQLPGQTVQLNSWTGGSNQRWIIRSLNSFSWDTTLADGTYSITSKYNQLALSHTISNNVAGLTEYTREANQRWNVELQTDGTYLLSPASEVRFNLELYYGSADGACNNGQPFTLNNYTNNTGSPYIRVHLKSDGNGGYVIYPLVTPTKCLTVYTGADTTYTFNSRVFTKTGGRSVHNWLYSGASTQAWTFTPLAGLSKDSTTVKIGSKIDLQLVTDVRDNVPITSWSVLSGADKVFVSSSTTSTTQTYYAKALGEVVFQTVLSTGAVCQYTVTITESRPIDNGLYTLQNHFSEYYIDVEGHNAREGFSLEQYHKIDGEIAQIWYLEYAENGGYMISPGSDTALKVTAVINAEGTDYTVQLTNGSGTEWAIVESETGVYNIIPLNAADRFLGIDPVVIADETPIVAESRTNGANNQEWQISPAEIKKAVILLHGRASNTDGCFGAVNAIGANDNDEADANISGTSIDGNEYTDYLSQYISSVHNESSEEGNLAYYLATNGYTKNVNLFAFNYPNKDAVIHSANKFKVYVDDLIAEVKNSNNLVAKQALEINGDDYSFNIVCHSMGGLVARYYIENCTNTTHYSNHSHDNGECEFNDNHVEKLITIDTPHWGSGYADDSWIGDVVGAHLVCDHDLDFDSKMYGGDNALILNCILCNLQYTITDELDYDRARQTKYYAIAGVDYISVDMMENTVEVNIPASITSYDQLLSHINTETNNMLHHTNYDENGFVIGEDYFSVFTESDNVVGFLSQIGWSNNPDQNAPAKKITMEKIYVIFDTNGGNSLISMLHTKIQHREKVLEKVLNYLSE